MMNYQCELCGAYLDPGEHCDCTEEKEQKVQKLMDMLQMEKDGQFVLNIGGQNGIKEL